MGPLGAEAHLLETGNVCPDVPHVNLLSLHMTTGHLPATENSTPELWYGRERYPHCPGEGELAPSIFRRLVGSSGSDPGRLRRPWS